jgi:DNA-binding NarL/FixJ family response regulator
MVSRSTRSLLLVQDSLAVITRMKQDLVSAGLPNLRVVGAASAQEALEVSAQQAVDLVLVDVHLAAPGATELVRQLRERHGQQLPIAFSFVPSEDAAQELIAAQEFGPKFVLPKPYDLQDFVDRVRLVLQLDLLQAQEATRQTQQKASRPTTSGAGSEQHLPGGGSTGPCEPQLWQHEVEHHLKLMLGSVPFRLIQKEGAAEHPPEAVVVTLLSATPEQQPWGVAALDMAAACMVGGGALELPPSAVRPAIADASPTPQMIAAVARFWRECVASQATTWCPPTTITRTAIIKADSDLYRILFPRQADSKFLSIPHGTNKSSKFSLVMPGYGQGMLSMYWFER